MEHQSQEVKPDLIKDTMKLINMFLRFPLFFSKDIDSNTIILKPQIISIINVEMIHAAMMEYYWLR